MMTTNMSEMFNSVIKGARRLPVTTLVQLTFFKLNSYFVVRREQVITYWHQMSSILHMLMLRLRHIWLKLDHLRLLFTIC